MELATVIGLIAASGTTAAFVPQVVRTWRTNSARDLSLLMIVVLAIGLLLWVVYGILRDDAVVIVANVITLALVSTLLTLKVASLRRQSREDASLTR